MSGTVLLGALAFVIALFSTAVTHVVSSGMIVYFDLFVTCWYSHCLTSTRSGAVERRCASLVGTLRLCLFAFVFSWSDVTLCTCERNGLLGALVFTSRVVDSVVAVACCYRGPLVDDMDSWCLLSCMIDHQD